VPSVAVEGTELYFERAGAGEPLLLIQGMSATHLAWGEPFLGRLTPSFECISFDNRGMGRSRPVTERFDIATMAGDTLALLDAIEVERAHVLGISMGGMIAQELALAHPQRLRSLTLGCTYCGGMGSQPMDPADLKRLAEAMDSGDKDRVFRAMYELTLSPGFRAEQRHYGEFVAMAAALPAPRGTIEFQIEAIAAHDTSARLPDLTVPTLILHGSADRMLGVANGRRIAALLPGSRLEIFDAIGHLFWWELPERTAALVRGHALTPA
jgi:pimeloyl-ACP methyl ester carboxylesterase